MGNANSSIWMANIVNLLECKTALKNLVFPVSDLFFSDMFLYALIYFKYETLQWQNFTIIVAIILFFLFLRDHTSDSYQLDHINGR